MEKKPYLATFLSGIYVLAACLLLLGVCRYCYPALGGQVRDALTGLEDSPVREAFGVLAEGLETGMPLKETLGETAEILFAHADTD